MDVHFEPWEGPKYSNPGVKGKKILVIGHTYPCNDYLNKEGCKEVPNKENGFCRGCGFTQRFCSEVTKETVKEYMGNMWQGRDGGRMKATHTKFLNSILPEVPSKEAYNYIAFYNFVQIAVNSNGERFGPTLDKYYELSIPPFLKTLAELQPDGLIVWGKPAYERLRYLLYVNGYIEGKIDTGDQFTVLYEGNEYPIMKIEHPSSPSFSTELWTSRIREFVQSLKKHESVL